MAQRHDNAWGHGDHTQFGHADKNQAEFEKNHEFYDKQIRGDAIESMRKKGQQIIGEPFVEPWNKQISSTSDTDFAYIS
jgi:hypothetical protein